MNINFAKNETIMSQYIDQIQVRIAPLKEQIIQHKVYNLIQNEEDLAIFMQYHIFAVWDFMSLLKALQNNLTCTSVPWLPKGDANTRYLINEIVVGEESDVDLNGIRKSHFELYMDAMQQLNVDQEQINGFIAQISAQKSVHEALIEAHVAPAIQAFVSFTFECISSGKDYLQAAIFTFGREDLIPGMFYAMVNDIYSRIPEKVSVFKYYLERHIEVDGDHHSHLALEMTEQLCGNDPQKWEEVATAIEQSLKMRIVLWDGVYEAIQQKNQL